MAFGSINTYEQNIRTTEGADASRGVKEVSSVKAANAAALGDAREGQVVTGEVSSVEGRTVKLTLPDSKVVTARLDANVKISVGESMAFEVKSNTGTQIALRPLFGQSVVNATAIKGLEQASILVDERSLAMASAMMDEGLPINAASLQGMYRLVNKYPMGDPANIVSMTHQGIPLSEESLEQFAAYKNNEHQLIKLAGELSESLTEMMPELPEDTLLGLSSIFNGDDISEAAKEMTDNLMALEEAGEAAASEEVPEEVFEKPVGILDIAARLHQAQESAVSAENESVPEAEEVVISFEAGEADTELGRLLDAASRQELAENLYSLGMGEESVAKLLNGEMSPTDALKYVQSAIALKDSIDSLNIPDEAKTAKQAAIRQITGGDAFKKLLGDALIKDFSLKNDGDISREKVDRLYERMLKDAGRAMQLLEAAGKGDSPLAKQLDNVNHNISFMNQLNEAFSYVQLPIQMSGENAHGDLYVYTNKKKLQDREGDVTALLHLEMEAMGTMDIHVTLSDANRVKTHFMLADDAMIDFVQEHIHILDERLKERGYDMTCDVALKDKADEDKNPAISAMLGKSPAHKGKLISRYSFDVKA